MIRTTALAIAGALIAAPAAAAEWRQAETPHFQIFGQTSENDLRKFATRLEQFHALLAMATGTDESRFRKLKVRVYLVPDIAAVRRAMGADADSAVAGYYDTQDDGALAVVPRSTGDGIFSGQLVLFHEYAHHFMLQYTPAAYPAWYVEGFAEIASTSSFERKGEITFGKVAQHRQWELGSGTPVIKMIDGSYIDAKRDSERWSYGDAWVLSHYLTFDKARAAQLRSYLNAVNAGRKPADAAAAFGDLGDLQRAVNVYAATASFPYRAVPVPEVPAGAVTITMMKPAAAALFDAQIELERRTHLPVKPWREPEDDAERKRVASFPQRLAEAKTARTTWLAGLDTLAARYPDDPAGWRLVADARCASEDYEACAVAARRALALAPGDSHAIARRIEAELELAEKLPGAERVAKVRAAQAELRAATEANPDDPLPLLMYYRSFNAMGMAADKDGLQALATYVKLVPRADGPRLTYARELLARGAPLSARRILAPLAFSPHESGATAEALAMIEAIDNKLAASS